MSIKSERRVWYAANVEAKPAGEIAGSPTYMSWVKRANAYMVAACIHGTSELRPEFIAEFKPAKVAKPATTKPAKVRELKFPARVVPNAIVRVKNASHQTVTGCDARNIDPQERWLVLSRHPNRGWVWLQKFDNPKVAASDFIAARVSACTIAANGVAASSAAPLVAV